MNEELDPRKDANQANGSGFDNSGHSASAPNSAQGSNPGSNGSGAGGHPDVEFQEVEDHFVYEDEGFGQWIKRKVFGLRTPSSAWIEEESFVDWLKRKLGLGGGKEPDEEGDGDESPRDEDGYKVSKPGGYGRGWRSKNPGEGGRRFGKSSKATSMDEEADPLFRDVGDGPLEDSRVDLGGAGEGATNEPAPDGSDSIPPADVPRGRVTILSVLLGKRFWYAILAGFVAIVILVFIFALIYTFLTSFSDDVTKGSDGPMSKEVDLKFNFTIDGQVDPKLLAKPYWREYFVDGPASFRNILESAKVKEADSETFIKFLDDNDEISKIKPWTTVSLEVDGYGNLHRETHFVDHDGEVQLVSIVKNDEGKWENNSKDADMTRFVEYRMIPIRTGFTGDLARSGMPLVIRETLRQVYKNVLDLDDLGPGDKIALIYETYQYRGMETGIGPIIASQISVRDHLSDKPHPYKDYKTYYYLRRGNNASNYFDEQGISRIKGFRYTPLEDLRITSPFGMRFHPILKRWRMHTGIDYGAARGTPIRAVDDGVIQFKGRKGGYGNVVEIKHDDITTTLYAHMSGFSGPMDGERVYAGDVIGYVGSTGYSTGPHLHFEVRLNGVPVDPTVNVTGTPYIDEEDQESFAQNVIKNESILNMLISMPVAVVGDD